MMEPTRSVDGRARLERSSQSKVTFSLLEHLLVTFLAWIYTIYADHLI